MFDNLAKNDNKTAVSHRDMANALRFLAVDAVEKANSGHPGMPMGMADVATVLYSRFLKFDPQNPDWPSRDRFVLSAGHGSMLLYALNYLAGYEAITLDELKNFRQLKSKTPGHPEVDIAAGIETTTGPLGQGISTAVGMALGERMMNARFGDKLINNYTYVIASDGDLMEGVSHEACALAGHLQLDRLIVFYDSNGISIDGKTELSYSDDVKGRFESYGWHVQEIDGHDPDDIAKATENAQSETRRPSMIICTTTIGYGAPNKAGTHGVHGSPLGEEELKATREALGWDHGPFDVPKEILEAWRSVGAKGQSSYASWLKTYKGHGKKDLFDTALKGDASENFLAAIQSLKQKIAGEKSSLATRKASGQVLSAIVPVMEELVGGSADLTPSNNTLVDGMADIKPGDYSGRYIRYGVREHGMAAVMNGLALYGGIIPYAGTFMTFSDYARPAMRLSALMKNRVIYVMTHDSIGLGEDGPTHQPVEHLAALRAIPNLQVFRPCDGVETAESWELAVQSYNAPSVLALTRQDLATLRTLHTDENLTAKGGYVLLDEENAQVTLMASGSEVEIVAKARTLLKEKGIAAKVVSMPCMELFAQQPEDYQSYVLGEGTLKVAVEAAIDQGWHKWIGRSGIFIGMESFGESAPYKELYEHFGITAENVVEKVLQRV